VSAAPVEALAFAAPGEAVTPERPPAPPKVRAPAPSRAPVQLLERLPVTRAAFDLIAPPDDAVPDSRSTEVALHVEPRSARRLAEDVAAVPGQRPLHVEYTLDTELMRLVFQVLQRGRVALGNVVVMEPTTGRVLAYASTDPERFPPTRPYPAASLVKVITAAAALDQAPRMARLPCRYTGSPYRLTPARIDPPASGNTISLRKALATSNNQCLAQLAVHALGAPRLMQAIDRFGWLDSPAPAHSPGQADAGEEPYDLGKLGSGLAGTRITPLHAAQLAAILVHGELIAPHWVERVVDTDAHRELEVPSPAAPRRVLSPELTAELRAMLVDTTRNGTARRAFRGRGGRPLLGPVQVAGKTGSLSGKQPDGRYEWFIGVAPADAPRVAIASLVVQDELWWRTSSQIAADVLYGVFCVHGKCDAQNVDRFIQVPEAAASLAHVVEEPDAQLN
jgi:cell division protein FtsI/penicillin-binding protein 2